MSRTEQNGNSNGSLKDIQTLVNNNSYLLNKLICKELSKKEPLNINWVSPLYTDNYAEYRDDDFVSLLGLTLTTTLNKFWPVRGPQWDALGKAKTGEVFLIEAKANIPEMVSSGTKATSAKSLDLITTSLNETKKFLKIDNTIDWSSRFYQYTNRLAHLYFLREINKVPAYLVNVYFINDQTVDGPTFQCEWEAAIKVMKCFLGINRHKLSKYMIDLFIDVKYL